MAVDDSTLPYYLNEVTDMSFIERRQRTERDHEGLYSYYRATLFAEISLSEGIDDLIRGEQAFEAMYGSSSGS